MASVGSTARYCLFRGFVHPLEWSEPVSHVKYLFVTPSLGVSF